MSKSTETYGRACSRFTLQDIMDRAIPEPNTGCWLWEGASQQGVAGGYGSLRIRGVTILAHRLVAILMGRRVSGLAVRHTCDQPLCICPDHLVVGTIQDNANDMAERKRGTRGSLPYGVRRSGRKFFAEVKHRGRQLYLGTFETMEHAAEAALVRRRELLLAARRERIET